MWTAGRAASRKVRQEGVINRFASYLLIALLAIGCSGKKHKTQEPEAPDESVKEEHRLYTNEGSIVIRDPKTLEVTYEIQWEKSQVDYTQEEGARSGRLEKVSGKLYQEGKLASTFKADSAYADQVKKLLRLEGHVTITATPPPTKSSKKPEENLTLTCEKMSWRTDSKLKPEEKLLKATGHVVIRSGDGQIGPTDELWCLPDLKEAGTPGFYKP